MVSLAQIMIGIAIVIGFLVIALGFIGYSFLGFPLPLAIFLVILGICIIVITIILYFIIL